MRPTIHLPAILLALLPALATPQNLPPDQPRGITVDIATARSRDEIHTQVQAAATRAVARLATLSAPSRQARKDQTPFTTPLVVTLTRYGVPLPNWNRLRSRAPEPIVPTFQTTGPRAFPADYRNFLESVFTAARPAMDAAFGTPAAGGPVRILNYDADLPARQAVAGGIYIPNAPGGPEIHFPVYQSPASAGVNYIHTLLLAYQGGNDFLFDAYSEGFVRAATMAVARVPNSIPNVTPDAIEQTLDSLYDISETYTYSNVPGVGAPRFIAPNLLNDPLPPGGSTGGVYLLRHKMAGTAWAKLATEHPAFIARFNSQMYASPGTYLTQADLEALALSSLTFVTGGNPAPTVEGLPFITWLQRQAALDPRLNPGLKIIPEAFPIEPTPGSNDFGVFGIVLNAFRTAPNGDETLLSGTSFPVYFRNDFARFFTTVQDDIISIAGGFGAVAPNFPARSSANIPYRVAIDLPFGGKLNRLYLPAGAVATGTDPAPRNLYGTLVGFDDQANLAVIAEWNGGSANMNVRDGAFSTAANTTFDPAQPVRFRVLQGSTVLLDTRVNKGRGPLAVDLRSDDSFTTVNLLRPDRLTTLGLPIDPFRPNPADLYNLPDNRLLLARWDPFNGRYNLYPNEGEVRQGLGYFVRPGAGPSRSVAGRTSARTPLAVHLLPGWNLVSVPSQTPATSADILVTTTTQAFSTWAAARGALVGDTVFRFVPDPVNPDAGTLAPAGDTLLPSEAYFVRALRAEGAVLLFQNAGRSRATRSRAPEISPAQTPRAETRPNPRVQPQGFFVRIIATTAQGHLSELLLGQNNTASDAPDPQDHPLPTGPGGFQLASLLPSPHYRDIRAATRPVFQINLSGLTPGQTVTLAVQELAGSPAFHADGLPGGRRPLSRSNPLTFRAAATTHAFRLTTR